MPFETHKLEIEENGHKQTVIIPKSDDPSYDNYLIEAETEKTRSELKKKPAPSPVKAEKREVLAQALRERQAYNRRRAESPNRKFY